MTGLPEGVPREIPLPSRVGELLALARSEAPAALLPEAAWERLAGIEDPLPPVATEAALECRLEEGADRVDFEVCLRGGRRRLAAALEAVDPAALAAGWRRPARFLRAWCDPAHPLSREVRVVWLEFDAAPGEAAPSPFAVLTLDPERFYASGTADPAALLATLDTGLGLLAGGLDPDARRALGRTVRGLPPSGQLLHAAVRPDAAGDFVRLVVRMPWRLLPGWLAERGWPGDPRALARRLETLCTGTVAAFNLDVGAGGLGPRVGVEFHRATAPRSDRRWIRLFDALEEAGACTAAKRALLCDWPSPRHGPEGPGLRVQRDLLVKAVWAPGAPLRAKAYLPFGPRLALA